MEAELFTNHKNILNLKQHQLDSQIYYLPHNYHIMMAAVT